MLIPICWISNLISFVSLLWNFEDVAFYLLFSLLPVNDSSIFFFKKKRVLIVFLNQIIYLSHYFLFLQISTVFLGSLFCQIWILIFVLLISTYTYPLPAFSWFLLATPNFTSSRLAAFTLCIAATTCLPCFIYK